MTERDEHIQRTVDKAPPLTPEQINRLTALFDGGGAKG